MKIFMVNLNKNDPKSAINIDPKINKEGLKDMMPIYCNFCRKYSHIPYKDWLAHMEHNVDVKCPLCGAKSDRLDFHPGKM